MAKRKKWQAALSGLGEGIANVSNMYLQRSERDRQSNLIGQRQLADDQRKFEQAINLAITKNEMTPEQGAAMLAAQGIKPNADRLQSVRPSLRSRMELVLGPEIAKATTPEMVPDDQRVQSIGRGQGGFDPMFQGPMPEGEEAFAGFAPEVREYRAQAETKRRSLRSAPTESLDVVEPTTGATSRQFVSKYSDPIQTKPASAQQGVLAGQQTVSELGVSGPAKAEQAGREATATAKARDAVENSPSAINARVSEAGRKAGASKTAEINAQIANAEKLIDFETKKALASLATEAQTVETREWAKSISDARTSANDGIRVLGQLRALFEKAQPEIEKMAAIEGGGMLQQLDLQVQQGWRPRGTLPESVRLYLDFLEAARPRLARMMGNVGQFTEAEQARGGFLVPDFVDAVNGGRTGREKLDRIEAVFMAAPTIAKMSKPGSAPMTADQISAVVDAARNKGKGDTSGQQFDFLLNPDGTVTQVPRRPQ